ncbi:MAG: hypothetical protein HYV63_20095 [Candidatus Schekmanbacteria bacterium]|nr:hypothetical protein [Candidatus Schekmanbacteria bacterium]
MSKTPANIAPAAMLKRASFQVANLARNMLNIQAPFTTVGKLRSREQSETADWWVEVDALQGRALLISKRPAGEPAATRATAPTRAALKEDSMRLLKSFGIPYGELGEVVQTAAMGQVITRDNQVGAPTLHAHKTFVFRTVNGIRVDGHRSVITHTPAGALSRALIKWPPLAASGHRMTSRFTPAEIQNLAQQAISARGDHPEKVRLRWRYEPVSTPTGEVVLKLRAQAVYHTREGKTEEHIGEPTAVNLDVSGDN